MPKLFVSEIQPQMQVDSAFRIADRQLRANRQGNLYLLMQLQDRTGIISGMRWNADEKLAERFVKGSYVQVQGASQLHNGILQLIVNQINLVDEKVLDPADFDSGNRVDVELLWTRLGELIATISNETVRKIAECFYNDPAIAKSFCLAPAGIKTHHAYPGGLLEHVVSLMGLADRISSHYSVLNRDLMLAGAMLHDIGKLEELLFEGELSYSDAGQLLGHLVQGVQMLDSKVRELSAAGFAVDPALVLRLQHIIVSHHGYLEHGSPKVPMTVEALAFHYLDEMDAKLNAALALVESDRTRDAWTTYNPTLGRKILKP
ncbi:MAG: HDIG domain-containing protein [Planctomycetota bacterium]|nr:HDIG domain-containing protein [Planctomycetota bacterium]